MVRAYRKPNMTDTEMKEWLETQYDLDENGCWIWKSYKVGGYGRVMWNGKLHLVHRLYWLLSGKTIPEGTEICHGHGCSKACYNPEHLRTDTHKHNMLDTHRDGTMIHAKLTCEQVLEIRSQTDTLQKELAIEYGVSREQISNIQTGKKWAWL